MKLKYDFISHLGLFIIYNIPFIISFLFLSLILLDFRWERIDNYFWDGKLFYYIPAKYIHLLINCYIFYTVKFKIMEK